MFDEGIGYGGKYELIRGNVPDNKIRNTLDRIIGSGRFSFGELSHVVLKDTELIVGYVGNSTLELCCPEEQKPELYKRVYKHLKKIFRASVN